MYTPEILTKTTMVNFAVKEQGLTSQLLGIVVRKERPQLEQMKDTLVLSIARDKKVLVITLIHYKLRVTIHVGPKTKTTIVKRFFSFYTRRWQTRKWFTRC